MLSWQSRYAELGHLGMPRSATALHQCFPRRVFAVEAAYSVHDTGCRQIVVQYHVASTLECGLLHPDNKLARMLVFID